MGRGIRADRDAGAPGVVWLIPRTLVGMGTERRRTCVHFAVACCVLLILGGAPDRVARAREPTIAPAQPLVADPVLVEKVLGNGLRVWLYPTAPGTNTLSLRLHVRCGSLHETEQERGYAHFVEHMAFRGSTHFKGGAIEPYLRSIGAGRGDWGAYTRYDDTVYTMDLPTATGEALGHLLRFFADVFTELTFAPERVAKEIDIIREERRSHEMESGMFQSEIVACGLRASRYAQRAPLGTPAAVAAATPEALRAFHSRWYRPERATLVITGDLDLEAAKALVHTHCAAFAGRGRATH